MLLCQDIKLQSVVTVRISHCDVRMYDKCCGLDAVVLSTFEAMHLFQ